MSLYEATKYWASVVTFIAIAVLGSTARESKTHPKNWFGHSSLHMQKSFVTKQGCKDVANILLSADRLAVLLVISDVFWFSFLYMYISKEFCGLILKLEFVATCIMTCYQSCFFQVLLYVEVKV